MSEFETEAQQLNYEMIDAHNKHYDESPTGLVDPKESPNGNIIYHLYSDGEITSQKGGWAYLQRSEFTNGNNYSNSNCKKFNLKLAKEDDHNRTYVVLTEDECKYFRSKMFEILRNYKMV